ncbi:MAG: TonB-dependent receptor [Bacteroidota bacterium]|nr:TonB-dependent receptor [Bacteroidota bacterium]
MLRKIYFSIIATIALGVAGFAQNKGAIKATLIDEKTKEPLAFANVIVTSNGQQVGTGTTDFDGVVIIKPLDPGKYNVKAVYVGYNKKEMSGVQVFADKTAYVNIGLINDGGVQLDEVQIISYTEPLIDPDTKSGGTVTREEYQNMATKNINSVASTTAGVYQEDEGDAVNVRGARSGNTQIFIDGERAIGTSGIPQQGVEQVSVILGGLPAQYGDATGGVISVTTRGPQPKFFGGVEAISSQITDKYGYNFIGFSVGGPIWSKKDSTGAKKPKIGFFLAGEAFREKDPDPSAVGVYTVNDEKLAEITAKPLIKQEDGSFLPAATFITKDDMVLLKARPNVAKTSFRVNPKIDFKITDNLNITLGGSWDYNKQHAYSRNNSMFNAENNAFVTRNVWRTYVRLQQKFGKSNVSEEEKSQSVVKNAYLSFQVGYQKNKEISEDDTHKDKFFRYGYVGKFNTYASTALEVDTIRTVYYDQNGDGITDTVNLDPNTAQNGELVYYNVSPSDSLVTFTPQSSPYNQSMTNYTTQFFDEFGYPVNSVYQVYGLGGNINGLPGQTIHSLYTPSGNQYVGYVKNDESIFRITSSFSADIKNHALMVGFEFDQRDYRNFTVNNAVGLWQYARQLTNQQFATLSSSSFTIDTTTAGDIVVNYAPDYTQISNFHYSLMDKFGYSKDDRINVDGLDPDQMSLDMFSPDELVAAGYNLVAAYGYDYYGNRLKKNVTFDDFATQTKKNARGEDEFTRAVGAFKPVYMSGYIQDKFDFKDMKFNIGVRIDRYDANQNVLADRYLLKPAYTRGEMTAQQDYKNVTGLSLAQGVPDDAVVYFGEGANAQGANVIGYRFESTWYDVNGNVVQDPKIILAASNGGANPALKLQDPFYASDYSYSNNAFKDYKPQINVMPRVAFSFPISDVANFFAHYDVLTQRPSDAQNRLDPNAYYYFQQWITQGNTFNNPDLKAEKTIDYELGFNQILNEKKSAALKLSAFYRELRNQVATQRLTGAYPADYISYSNLDFGTVKGFSVEFDMRRSGGFTLNANYTLQFAEGSGSSADGGFNLANTNQPNLRVTLPLDFDQRHTLTTTLDYRFGEGKDYNGPKYTKKKGDTEKTVQILQNVGANMVFRLGSGTPYTRTAVPLSDVMVGVQQNTVIVGALNGSYLPWQFRADMRVDKNFELEFGKSKPEEDRKSVNLNIYLQVLNVFNNKNIVNVHQHTGSPTDDGYLNSAQTGQQFINSTVAINGNAYLNGFVDQYRAKLNDGTYYNRPRVIRVGVLFEF